MSKPPHRTIFSYLLPFIILILILVVVYIGLRYLAPSNKEEVVPEAQAVLTINKGTVEIVSENQKFKARDGEYLKAGEVVKTGADSWVTVTYFDDSVTRLGADTEMKILSLSNANQGNEIAVRVEKGNVWTRVIKLLSPQSSFNMETPNTIAAVRGTAWETNVTVTKGTEDTAAKDTKAKDAVAKDAVAKGTEGKDVIDTEIKVVDNEVRVAAYESTETTGIDGATKTERKILDTIDVQVGQKVAVAAADLADITKGAKELESRAMTLEDKQTTFYIWNQGEDIEHLKQVKEKLRKKIEDADKQTLLDKILGRKKPKDNLIELFSAVEDQLRALPEEKLAVPAETTGEETKTTTEEKTETTTPSTTTTTKKPTTPTTPTKPATPTTPTTPTQPGSQEPFESAHQ